jgi:hypothetical protein
MLQVVTAWHLAVNDVIFKILFSERLKLIEYDSFYRIHRQKSGKPCLFVERLTPFRMLANYFQIFLPLSQHGNGLLCVHQRSI